MKFSLVSASSDYMVLIPKSAKYVGSTYLIEYTIGIMSCEIYQHFIEHDLVYILRSLDTI